MSNPNNLPVCRYGSKCYRQNVDHKKQFYHPSADEAPTIGAPPASSSHQSQSQSQPQPQPSLARQPSVGASSAPSSSKQSATVATPSSSSSSVPKPQRSLADELDPVIVAPSSSSSTERSSRTNNQPAPAAGSSAAASSSSSSSSNSSSASALDDALAFLDSSSSRPAVQTISDAATAPVPTSGWSNFSRNTPSSSSSPARSSSPPVVAAASSSSSLKVPNASSSSSPSRSASRSPSPTGRTGNGSGNGRQPLVTPWSIAQKKATPLAVTKSPVKETRKRKVEEFIVPVRVVERVVHRSGAGRDDDNDHGNGNDNMDDDLRRALALSAAEANQQGNDYDGGGGTWGNASSSSSSSSSIQPPSRKRFAATPNSAAAASAAAPASRDDSPIDPDLDGSASEGEEHDYGSPQRATTRTPSSPPAAAANDDDSSDGGGLIRKKKVVRPGSKSDSKAPLAAAATSTRPPPSFKAASSSSSSKASSKASSSSSSSSPSKKKGGPGDTIAGRDVWLKQAKGRKTGREQLAVPRAVQPNNHNKALTDILAQLGESEKASGNGFKARAYATAIRSIKSYPHIIQSGKEAEKLDGVGKKIAAKIDEILSTGSLQRLEEDKKDERLQALTLLNRVPGVGPVKARALVDQYGFRTLDDLRANPAVLSSHINTCLKYFEELEERIPRAEMDILNQTIRDGATTISKQFKCELELTTCGSYRRGATSSNDIDVLVTTKTFLNGQTTPTSLKALVTHLEKLGFITDELGFGAKKFSGICQLLPSSIGTSSAYQSLPDDIKDTLQRRLHRRIDIRFIPYDCYPCGVLYFTGSDIFNTQMRLRAIEMGYTLNEYRICTKDEETQALGDPIPVTCERDVFNVLKMKWLDPTERG